jgi:16S rRNA (guanine1207-N2)-methyltransferase
VSASALHLTQENTKLNSITDVKIVAADMLSGLDKYDVIAVNPPFHVGISTTTAPTINMIINASEHLNKGGVLYLVANSHLGYGEILKQNFPSVEIISSSNTFTVYKAVNA